MSNRIFNDTHQNLFSENGVSPVGLRLGPVPRPHLRPARRGRAPCANIPFDAADPLEAFTNTLGAIPFTRSAAAPGTGRHARPAQQINTVSSYIDAWAVYGGTDERLDWLREGPVDGNPNNNGARAAAAATACCRAATAGATPPRAPKMAVDGRLLGQPGRAAVAGDVRANENIALTATHTLFAREHNRIVGLLPSRLSQGHEVRRSRGGS